MKIAFVVHTAYPDFIGGREHHVHNLARALSLDGHEIFVVAGGKVTRPVTTEIAGYTLISLPMLSITVSRNPLQIYRIIPRLLKTLKTIDADILHAFEYGSFTTDMTYLYSMLYKKPFVLTIYGYKFNNPVLRFAKFVYDHTLGLAIFKRAQRIICPSQAQLDELKGMLSGRSREWLYQKTIMQGNCIMCSEFQSLRENKELRKKYADQKDIVLLSVARLLPRKGMIYMVEAIRILKETYFLSNIKLLIIGPNCGELENIRRLIKSKALESNVIIIGAVPFGSIKEYFSVCDIFVLPSLYEGLPLSLLEAMAAGKAVVFTKLPCAEKAINDKENGILVEAGNADSLAQGLAMLVNDRKLRSRLGMRAAESVLMFDSKNESKRMCHVYAQLLAK
jgi:glycosyltransferase involved in cell wall biosynthesis